MTGCSLGAEPPVTFVVVTSTPESAAALPAQAATATLAPQPTVAPATPELPADTALQEGDRQLLNGYYEDAVELYQTVLNREGVAPEIQAAAAYGQGQAALREGLFADAVDAFTILIERFPEDVRGQQAYFLRGDALLGLARWTEAINDYRQYLRLRPNLIDSYVHERIGDAFLAINFLNDALTSYSLAADSGRDLVSQLALREKVAQVYLSSDDVAGAITQYDSILAQAQNAPYRAEIEFRAGNALIESDDVENGLVRMQRVFNEYAATTQAVQAMEILRANGRDLNQYQAGRIYFFNEDYQAAIQAFNNFTTITPPQGIEPELYQLLGLAYRAVGNSPAALVAFQTIIDIYPTDPVLVGEALLEQGRTRFLSGDIPAAINFYLQIADNPNVNPASAAEALWRAAYLYGTSEDYTRSREIFLRLADSYPDTEQTRSGLAIAASAAASIGDDSAAETLFRRLATSTTGLDQAAAWFQVGRLAQQRGDSETAADAFRQTVAASPDSYYSARASDIIAGQAPFTPPSDYVFNFDTASEQAAAENWLRSTFGIQQTGQLSTLSPEIANDPRLVRGRELWAMAAWDDAETEFLNLLEAYQTDALVSYQLAILLRDLGSYYPSQVGAANLIRAAGLGTLNVPPYIARLRYPAYYLEPLLETTGQYGIDPLLMYSLIRHESLFDTNATAAAGEKGLTQVIPNTGEYIAGQLNWPDYQHSDLFRPHAGIAFGAFYLAEQLGRFDGNVYAALAGYNAGPGRAIDWLNLSGGDPDLFMSTITISSVQTYIQSIYRHYNIYRVLYGA